MAQPKTRVRPVHLILAEGHGETRLRRCVAWRVVCDCEYRSAAYKQRREAVADKRYHRDTNHAEVRLSIAGPL